MRAENVNERQLEQGLSTTVRSDGRVLIVGGFNADGVVANAQIYDPDTKSFGAVGERAATRGGHSAILLADGGVLVAGGENAGGPLNSAELLDPATGSFRAVGSTTNARRERSATVLADGRVLISGGDPGGTAELSDPAAEAFNALSTRRRHHAGDIPRPSSPATVFYWRVAARLPATRSIEVPLVKDSAGILTGRHRGKIGAASLAIRPKCRKNVRMRLRCS